MESDLSLQSPDQGTCEQAPGKDGKKLGEHETEESKERDKCNLMLQLFAKLSSSYTCTTYNGVLILL